MNTNKRNIFSAYVTLKVENVIVMLFLLSEAVIVTAMFICDVNTVATTFKKSL